jgi:hypothetical protein
MTLDAVTHEVLRGLLGTRVLANPALAEDGTNANKFEFGAFDFCINGFAYTKAATDNLGFSAGHDVQAVSEVRYYLLQINAAGTVSTKQSAAGGRIPDPDLDNCPFGVIKITTDASTTFTPNTDDLGAAGVTDAYYNIGVLPANMKP